MQAASSPAFASYPARIEGHLDQPSRWLWLVKWLLAAPHYVVLAFLWMAFVLLSFVAFAVVLFTGRYPRGIFGFNVGVLRWTWRVSFYAFGANGTDRYPPFTLDDVADYPARLDVAYPESQRRGLPLIGWWLAGIPQYILVGIFLGGAGGAGWQSAQGWPVVSSIGLIGVLVCFGVVALLFRGSYPRAIFDLVLGLDRWVVRVAAYAALMTREYPPFRLDAGEDDTGALSVPATVAGPASEAAPRAHHWTAGRVILVVLGALASLGALACIAAGAVAIAFDQTQRDAGGYLMTHGRAYATPTYALVSDSYRGGAAGDVSVARDLLGTVRIQTSSTRPVFVGIAPTAAVDGYLAGVRHEVVPSFDAGRNDYQLQQGGPPAAPPAEKAFWAVHSMGVGTQVLTWQPRSGSWRIVVMDPAGRAGVHADVSIGAKVPHLLGIGIGILVGAGVLAVAGIGMLYAGFRRP